MNGSSAGSHDEAARLAAVRRIQEAGATPLPGLVEIARLAAQIAGTPWAGLCLVGADRLHWIAAVGLQLDLSSRQDSLCADTVLQDGVLVVNDTAVDPRCTGHAPVAGLDEVRFFAGAPLQDRGGHKIGILCVFDRVPNRLGEDGASVLRGLARAAVTHLELQRADREILALQAECERARAALEKSQAVHQSLSRAEADFIRERDLVARIAETSPAGIAVVDRTGQIVFANARAEQILGITRDQITKRRFDAAEWCLTDFEGRSFPAEKLPARQVFESRRPVHNVEHAIEWPDGRRVLLSVNAAPLLDPRDEVEAVVATIEDVTERKRSEEAFRASEERYRSFITNSSEAIWRIEWEPPIPVDLSPEEHARINFERAVVAECNDVFARQYGAARAEDVVGKHYADLLPAPEPSFFDFLAEFAKSGFCLSGKETEETDPTGRTHFFVNNVVGIVKDGYLHRAWGTQTDITERKRAERALRESEERYRAIFDGASEGILIADAQTRRLRYANPAIASMLKYTESELVGLDIASIHPPDDVPPFQATVAAASAGKRLSLIGIPCRRKDGSVFLADISEAAIEIGGEPCRLEMFTDVSERRRGEQARAAFYRIAELASGTEQIETFYAAVHDVVRQLLHAENFYIALYDRDSQTLHFPFMVDRKPVSPGSIPADGGLAGYVLRTGRPLLCPREKADDLVNRGELILLGERCVDWLGVPLKRGDEVIGVLAVQSYDPALRFRESDQDLLAFVSQHVATALERKRAADALRESEERYRKLIDQSPYGITVLAEERVVFANPSSCRILGAKDSAEILGRTVDQLTSPDSADLLRERLSRTERGEENPPIESQWRRLDGTRRWLEISSSVLTFRGRQAFQVMLRDLSEEKRAEARVTTQAAVTRILAESADTDDAIPRLLDTVCAGLGWDVGELWMAGPAGSGQLILQVRHSIGNAVELPMSELPAKQPSLPGQVWVEGEAVWHSTVAQADDGPWKDAVSGSGLRSAAAFPVGGARGVAAVLAFMSREAKPADPEELQALTDIGQRIGQFFARKRVEEERERLREAVQRAALEWRLTFDAVETVIVILDGQARIIRLNAAAQRAAEMSFDQVLGRRISEVAPAEPWVTAAAVATTAAAGKVVRSAHVRDSIGGRSWEITAAPLTGPSQWEGRVIVVAQDVTRTVALQESVRRAETMAAMGSLVAGVAHEVRNPLFALSTNVDALDATLTDKTGLDEIIEALRRSVARLSKLMEDLLEYGRTSGAALTPGPLSPVVSLALKSCAPLAQSRGVTLINSTDDMELLTAMDRDRLEQVFENLIKNAVYHSPPGGSVRVEAERFERQEKAWVRVLVSDEGPGFRVEDLARVFQPFFSRRRGGIGLGLSIVDRIVQAHGGRVQAANRPARGAVLTVELPCVE